MTIQLATASCAKCGRILKSPSVSGFGPKCERAVLGRTTKKRKSVVVRSVDPRQVDWVQEVRT